ncbi:MAG: hypothetical protein J6J25_04370 [Bacteroidales bacterium]|nr:hypothetical protein [Bacteroidaceae bacterium]MBP3662323.1 hypothetical protein [Bacteroidales bacterium]
MADKINLSKMLEDLSKVPFKELGASAAIMIVQDQNGIGQVLAGGKNIHDLIKTLLNAMSGDPQIAAVFLSAVELYKETSSIVPKHGTGSKSYKS